MTTKTNKELIQSFFDAGNRGDMDHIVGLFADDIKWTTSGTTKFSGTFDGKQTLLDNLLGGLFSQLKAGIFSEIENIVAEGEFVVAQTRGKAETTDGKNYDNNYCHIFKLQDGKIKEVTEYLDTALTNSVFGE